MNLKIEKEEVSTVSSKSDLMLLLWNLKGGGALHTSEIQRLPREDADNSLWYMFC